MKPIQDFVVKCMLCALLMGCFSIVAQAATSPTIEIVPSRFEILVEPRGQNVQSLKISNLGKEPVTMVATTHDWDMGEDERLILKDPGTTDNSASEWVRFNPKTFTVQPGQTQFIRFSVSVPPNVQPGEYRTSLVLVTEEKYQMKENFYYRPTFAILVYVNIPKITRKGELSDVKVTVDEKGSYSLNGKITSLGNAHLRLTGEYFLYNNEGKEIKNEQFGKTLILPGKSDLFSVLLGGDLKPGSYRLKLIWHYLPAFYMDGKLDEYPLNEKGLVKEFTFTI